jgi:hypothetical protein
MSLRDALADLLAERKLFHQSILLERFLRARLHASSRSGLRTASAHWRRYTSLVRSAV